ncbi:MAG: serine hydrolase, partial [Bacteroidetes bacterium]|nr:serine hydrolase [Bacteroidota bacterium]
NYFVPGGTYYSAANNFYFYHSGTRTNYSNIGATLAAYLVQRISGDDYSHYCDTAIFAKLCMDNTALKLAGLSDTTLIARPYRWTGTYYFDEGLYGYPDYPDGQLRTNITALARFMTMYTQHGIYNGERILNSATVDTMLSPQHNIFGQGIFFYRYLSNGDTLWGHTGGDAGVSTAMFFNMQKQIGAIVFCNGDGTITNNMQTIFDQVYKYGLTVTPAPTDTFPACHYTYTAVPQLAMNNAFTLNIYPNPTADLLHIDINGRKANHPLKLTITNMVGAISQVQMLNSDNITINTSGLSNGIYILRIEGDGQQQIMKFVKN